MKLFPQIVCFTIVVVLGTQIYSVLCTSHHETDNDDYPDITPAPPPSSTPAPAQFNHGGDEQEQSLPLCPPKPPVEEVKTVAKILLVSTLDGQLSALDLNKDGEMIWSVSMYPGTLLDSTISNMDLDNRGYFVKLIPSLTGRLYKFDGEVVQQIPMDVDTLLGSSQKMQENIVITGGKETRTYGINAKTGEVLYECSMSECSKYQDTSTEDIFVVQCNTKTVRAHTPKSGDQKWNFSVSLHDVSFYPGQDPCNEEEDVEETDNDNITLDNIKTVVPEGIVCSTRDDLSLKWKRKFSAPIVDMWRLSADKLSKIDLFSKNHIPRRDILLDDKMTAENPSLYIGKHNDQLYIQESINLLMGGGMLPDGANSDLSHVDFPRVSWKPYMVSPSRTPIINLQKPGNLISSQQTYDPVIQRQDSRMTALALTSGNTEYPYDSGFYLYTDSGASLDPDDPVANITSLVSAAASKDTDEDKEEETTVELIYMSLWHWWKEVLIIAAVTAIMTNLLITQPIVHNMRYDFQDWSRQVVAYVEVLQRERNAAQQNVREVMIEVPVPSLTNNTGSTPSTSETLSGSGPDFSSYIRQPSEFQSRFQSDFEPVQCLGKGGFGIVFECKNKYDDVHYAVKRITLPPSEDDKKKVRREVKLHAKLDHKHIVRYYTTWEENPPPGWQKSADCWYNEEDLGSLAPTQCTQTDYSYTESKVVDVGKKGCKQKNPFYQYSISSTNSGEPNDGGISSSLFHNKQFDQDDSFSVKFEYSNCDNNTSDASSPGDDHHNDEAAIDDEASNSKNKSHNLTIFPGFDDKDESSGAFVQQHFDDTTSGGIHFAAPEESESAAAHGIVEIRGRNEAVSLNLEDSLSGQEGSVNSDCFDALVWDSKEKKEEKKRDQSLKSLSYLYIVMQLCRKETLRDWLRNTAVRSQHEIMAFFYQICVGVEYVHRQGLIHRDLKPSNIYFSHDGIVKIGDFGLVTGGSLPQDGGQESHPGADGDVSRNISSDQLTDKVGTQSYMSPEQLNQQSYNHKVDIYSLGLIFLELCVCFSTQMERVHTLSAARKQIFPDVITSNPDYKYLLTRMLNSKADMRPEAEDILELEWLQEYKESVSWKRKRLESTGSDLNKSS